MLKDDEEDIDIRAYEGAFKQADTGQAQMAVGDILKALKSSCSFFMNFFIPEELEYEIPEFHKKAWMYLIIQEVEKIALALPRGHAKTTLAKLVVVWYFLFTPFRFVLYVSNTHSIAAESAKDIINYMESDNFQQVFGQLEFDVKQDQRGFYKFKLKMIDEAGNIRIKYCILRAIGAGQQIRGTNIDNTRPELAVVDDLEDDQNTKTAILIKQMVRWFMGPFLKAMSRKQRKVLYLGNMLSNKSLLYHFCENSDEWYSLRYGCLLSNGEPLWQDLWPIDKIRADFLEYQKLGLVGLWFAEMMNMPIAEGNLLIQPEDIRYRPHIVPGEHKAAFITIDPAISLKTWADDRAIVVHALTPHGTWQIAEYLVGKFTPDELFILTCELAHKWNTRCVGIEQGGFQIALKYLFETLMVIRRQSFDIYEIPHKNRSKVERLTVWCSLMRQGQWWLNEGDYAVTQQLLMFDPTKDANQDDLIDACSMGAIMIDMYLASIMDSYTISKDQYRVISGSQVARH